MRKLPADLMRALAKAGVKPKSSKYRAVPTVVDGIRFDSKAEAEYYRRLKLQQENGEVWFFLRQVPFDLPGGYRHRIGFMVIDATSEYDRFMLIEIKGKDVATGKMKRKQVEELYGIKVHVLKAVYRRGVIVDFEEVES